MRARDLAVKDKTELFQARGDLAIFIAAYFAESDRSFRVIVTDAGRLQG